ncbi:MAG: hypothetical protein ABI311_03165, partial [Gemmatimonadaceae bacterium]
EHPFRSQFKKPFLVSLELKNEVALGGTHRGARIQRARTEIRVSPINISGHWTGSRFRSGVRAE